MIFQFAGGEFGQQRSVPGQYSEVAVLAGNRHLGHRAVRDQPFRRHDVEMNFRG